MQFAVELCAVCSLQLYCVQFAVVQFVLFVAVNRDNCYDLGTCMYTSIEDSSVHEHRRFLSGQISGCLAQH